MEAGLAAFRVRVEDVGSVLRDFCARRSALINALTDDSAEISLFSREAAAELNKQSYNIFHIGMIVIGIKGLTRKGTGAKTLVTIADKGMDGQKKQLIATIEADMNQNVGLFYCSPDITMTVKSIQKFIKIGVLTQGYGDIKHENLAITVAVLGRLSHYTPLSYKININGLMEAAASKGIGMIKSEAEDPTILAGKGWDLSKLLAEAETTIVPGKSSFYKDSKGNLSVRFSEKGCEWDLSKLLARAETTTVPDKSSFYEDSKGNLSVRFSDYQHSSNEQ
ncbi:hypothetical protein K1719_010362 [Acacia pycnantha]|nr:hypothetical protein K1719_010362 [Acacia pycnantha]